MSIEPLAKIDLSSAIWIIVTESFSPLNITSCVPIATSLRMDVNLIGQLSSDILPRVLPLASHITFAILSAVPDGESILSL